MEKHRNPDIGIDRGTQRGIERKAELNRRATYEEAEEFNDVIREVQGVPLEDSRKCKAVIISGDAKTFARDRWWGFIHASEETNTASAQRASADKPPWLLESLEEYTGGILPVYYDEDQRRRLYQFWFGYNLRRKSLTNKPGFGECDLIGMLACLILACLRSLGHALVEIWTATIDVMATIGHSLASPLRTLLDLWKRIR